MQLRTRAHHAAAAAVAAIAVLALFSSTAASAPQRQQLTTVSRLHPADRQRLPLTLGINKGFFAAQGLDIKTTVLQSGNDIVLAMSNKQADIGYVGYVPAMIARTTGIPLTIIAASEVEGTSAADNWQDILVKGSSSIQTPAQLAGKTIAVNALKGVGEVVDPVGVEEVRRRPQLRQSRRDAVPDDADGAEQRAGRRLLGARAVRHAGHEHRRRPHRDGSRPGARQVLPERRLRRAATTGSRRTRHSRRRSRPR